MVRTVLEDVGLATIAGGVALINLPAGIIVAGMLIVLAANFQGGARRNPPVAAPCGDRLPHQRHLVGDPPIECPGIGEP